MYRAVAKVKMKANFEEGKLHRSNKNRLFLIIALFLL